MSKLDLFAGSFLERVLIVLFFRDAFVSARALNNFGAVLQAKKKLALSVATLLKESFRLQNFSGLKFSNFCQDYFIDQTVKKDFVAAISEIEKISVSDLQAAQTTIFNLVVHAYGGQEQSRQKLFDCLMQHQSDKEVKGEKWTEANRKRVLPQLKSRWTELGNEWYIAKELPSAREWVWELMYDALVLASSLKCEELDEHRLALERLFKLPDSD